MFLLIFICAIDSIAANTIVTTKQTIEAAGEAFALYNNELNKKFPLRFFSKILLELYDPANHPASLFEMVYGELIGKITSALVNGNRNYDYKSSILECCASRAPLLAYYLKMLDDDYDREKAVIQKTLLLKMLSEGVSYASKVQSQDYQLKNNNLKMEHQLESTMYNLDRRTSMPTESTPNKGNGSDTTINRKTFQRATSSIGYNNPRPTVFKIGEARQSQSLCGNIMGLIDQTNVDKIQSKLKDKNEMLGDLKKRVEAANHLEEITPTQRMDIRNVIRTLIAQCNERMGNV